jgi:spermidine/putrescine transport system substrate-binding protein
MEPETLRENLRSGGASRREFLRTIGAAGLALVTVPLVNRQARAGEQATYFTWGGYDYPALFSSYTKKHGNKPEFSVYADAEEGFQKLRSGYVVDTAHPCYNDVLRWRTSGLFQPIDTTRLSNWADVMPKLQMLDGSQIDGEQWFVPVDWGQTSITYRTDLIDLEGQEESWGILWNERYSGKISMIGAAEDSWYAAAVYAGVDVNNITDTDFGTVRELLTRQRPYVRLYSSDFTSLEQALASGELVAAMTWNDSVLNLRSQGLPVKFANPKEGALTWCCGVMLHKDAPSPDKAHDVIDALIDAETGAIIINEFGYGHSNTKSFELVDDSALADRGLSKNPFALLEAGHFIGPQDPEIATKINRDWEEIIAGF